MCPPEHRHVTIQNSPDNVSFRYAWSIPLNHSQIISLSFYTLCLYLLSNCAHVGRGKLCSICKVSVLVVGSGQHDIPFHIFHRHYIGFVPFWTIKYPICPWSKYSHATYHSDRQRERFQREYFQPYLQYDAIDSKYDDDGNCKKKHLVGSEYYIIVMNIRYVLCI